MTVRRLYRVRRQILDQDWEAETWIDDQVLVKNGSTQLWLTAAQFKALFVEHEMVTEMTVQEMYAES